MEFSQPQVFKKCRILCFPIPQIAHNRLALGRGRQFDHPDGIRIRVLIQKIRIVQQGVFVAPLVAQKPDLPNFLGALQVAELFPKYRFQLFGLFGRAIEHDIGVLR